MLKKISMNKLLSLLLNKKILASLVGLFFFILLFLGVKDYNIFWDARNHYFKGQAFVHFFLTGKKDYKDLPITKDYARYFRDYMSRYDPDTKIYERLSTDPNYRRSIYQDEIHTYDWLIKSDQIEHPVFSDIMSTFSNVIFYEKLGWLRDDYAYRVYTLALAALVVGVIFYWTYSLYGFFPAIISTLVLGTTPLFWAESHFNLKDVPQMAFFSLAIWQFWKGAVSKSNKNIIVSAVFAAFAFSTKLNIVFMPFILAPWFIVYYLSKSQKDRKSYNKWWWLLFVYPLIMLVIFIGSWPQMWASPIQNFIKVIEIYREIGVSPDYTPAFRTIFNFSTYASIWIIISTYPLVIIMSAIGIFFSFKNIRKTKDYLPLLFLLWFFVPIARASLPFTSIFGGVRHIMEYIPAVSMLAGYGVFNLLKLFPSKKTKMYIGMLLIVGFVPLIFTLVRLHPAENVYFNSFIGGLSGAKKANITGWGYNDGGIYRKATVWLNEHADKNSHIAVAFSEPADFYIPELREDLLADNLFSGYLQKGEYIIGLTHDNGLENTYRLKYSQDFLEPVYEYVVDGVPLIKIWKNDRKYLKGEFLGKSFDSLHLDPEIIENELRWTLPENMRLMAVEIEFDTSDSCKLLESASFQVSSDGQVWDTLPDSYPGGSLSFLGDQPKDNKLIAPIAGLWAVNIVMVIEPRDSCMFNVIGSNVVVLR